MDQASPAPLLDLDTLTTRNFIAIDGQRYFIRSPDELSVIESHRLSVVDVFTALLMRRAVAVSGAMHKAAGTWTPEMESALGSIGASSSPGSSGSTAETRKAGWLSFLSGLFERS